MAHFKQRAGSRWTDAAHSRKIWKKKGDLLPEMDFNAAEEEEEYKCRLHLFISI